MSYEESVSCYMRLENLEEIRRTESQSPATQPVDDKKSVTSSIGNSCKLHKGSNRWCHYCDKNNQNTADCRAISKFKQPIKACFWHYYNDKKRHFIIDIGPNRVYFSTNEPHTFEDEYFSENGPETIRVISDFSELNFHWNVSYHPFPIPKIRPMIRSMEGYTFASALGLNMNYYHIKIDFYVRKLHKIVFQ
jgi:hypothetical protein